MTTTLDKGNLLDAALISNKCTDHHQLLEWLPDEFECAVNIPHFGLFEVPQLLVCGHYQVTPVTDFNIGMEELLGVVILIYAEVKVGRISGPLSLAVHSSLQSLHGQ